jgi:hypothetical protein
VWDRLSDSQEDLVPRLLGMDLLRLGEIPKVSPGRGGGAVIFQLRKMVLVNRNGTYQVNHQNIASITSH